MVSLYFYIIQITYFLIDAAKKRALKKRREREREREIFTCMLLTFKDLVFVRRKA